MADPKQQQDINQLSTQDKLGEALNRALPLLPKEVRERVQELASPESVSAIATIGAVYVASHAAGVGEFGDVAVLGVGAVALGSETINVAKDLSSFIQDATQAKNGADLDRAAEHLASAVSKVSVDAVLAVLTHKAGKVLEEKLPRSAGSGVTKENQLGPSSVLERPSLPRESGQTPKNSEEVVAQLGSYVDDPTLSKRLRTPEEFEDLAKDPAENYQVKANSKVERMVALELENRGLLNHVVRDTRKLPVGSPSGDVIEGGGAGQIWDVKGFNSSFSPKKGGYTLERSLKAIEKEFKNGENVIIDTTKMYPEHIAELRQAVVERGWSERVLWDDPQLSPGKTIESEISQSKQANLPSVVSTLPITGAAAAQQTQSADAKETPQPQRVETSVSAAIISNGQADAIELEKADNQSQPDPELAAVKTYEKLIDTKGEYDSYYNVTRFKDGDYTARLEHDNNALSIESTDKGVLLYYNRDTQKLTPLQPLEEKDIQHFKNAQTKLDTSQQETPKVESSVRPQPVQLLGKAAPSSISQEQLDRVEDVARDYAYHHPDSQKMGENFTYESKDYQFAQNDQTLTITAKDGRDVILQMNTYTRDIAVNKITPEDSRQMTQMSSTTVLASERDAQARMVTDSALAVLDRYGKETKGGRFYSEGDYQISQQGDRKGAIQIIDARNGNELLYAKAEGVVRENLGEDDIQNFSTLKVQMEQQRAGPSPQQPQQEIGDLEMGGMT
jgi:hypothetical protein